MKNLLSSNGLKEFAASKGNSLVKGVSRCDISKTPSKGNVLVKRRFADIARLICETKHRFVTVQASLSKIFPKASKHSGAANRKTFKLIGLKDLKEFAVGKGNVLVKRRFADIARIMCESKCKFVTVQASLSKMFPKAFKRSFAFSLVEMLMALLVASLLLAALAPVMTKKYSETLSINSTGGIVPKTYCAYVNNGTAPVIKDTEGEGCLVPDNTYSASAIIASGGGGGGGAADMVINPVLKTLVSTVNNDTQTDVSDTAVFDANMKEITVQITGGGGGGGGGNYKTEGKLLVESQNDCEPFGVYIQASYNGGKPVCVSKYNPGENRAGSPELTGVTKVPAGSSCTGGNCCWYGNNKGVYNTSSKDACDASANGITYNGCYRTVCQWSAANTICDNWKPLGENGPVGRLPNGGELSAWESTGLISDKNNKPGLMNWNSTINAGLQICTHWTTLLGAPRCWETKACIGAATAPAGTSYKDYCLPAIIWSSDSGSDCHKVANIYKGTFRYGGCNNNTYAQSTRCVLDNTIVPYPFIAGGGGGGVFAKAKVPDTALKRALQYGNGTIKTYAGKKGAGSTKKSAQKAADGGDSRIEIYDTNGTIVWALSASGGKGGNGATVTNDGEGGAQIAAKCTYLDITNEKYKQETVIDCSLISETTYKGYPGISGDASENPGYGAESGWGSTLSSKTAAGTSASIPGAGGGGATCISNPNDNTKPTCYDGGNGGGGAVLVTYKASYPGIGGGGGGAGSVLHIKNFQTRPGDLIKVQIGHGGKGGTASNKGEDGGESYIELTRADKTIAKYAVLGGSGGEGGRAGVFSPSLKTPVSGKGGAGGKIPDSTKNKLTPSSSEYYPENSDEAKGGNAPEYSALAGFTQNSGGNGGTNSKISPLAPTDGSLNGMPCGGLNASEIQVNKTTKWSCSNISHIPLPLSRALNDISPFGTEIISNFAPGATGGGGGGWKHNETPNPASSGAKGLGGYVYIYFGDWNEGS